MHSDNKLKDLKAFFILGIGNKWEYEFTPSSEGINVTSVSLNPDLCHNEGSLYDPLYLRLPIIHDANGILPDPHLSK